jgi:hypothetical protein
MNIVVSGVRPRLAVGSGKRFCGSPLRAPCQSGVLWAGSGDAESSAHHPPCRLRFPLGLSIRHVFRATRRSGSLPRPPFLPRLHQSPGVLSIEISPVFLPVGKNFLNRAVPFLPVGKPVSDFNLPITPSPARLRSCESLRSQGCSGVCDRRLEFLHFTERCWSPSAVMEVPTRRRGVQRAPEIRLKSTYGARRVC